MNIFKLIKKSEAIGGDGGSEFQALEQDAIISKIDFYYNNHTLRGLEITFGNNQKKVFGSLCEKKKSIEFDKIQIKELKIYYSNFSTGRCNGISIITSDNIEIIAGNQTNKFTTIKNCTLIGVEGRSGSDIDQLAFYYMDKDKMAGLFGK